MRIVFSSWQRTIWANIPTYPDKDDVNYIIDGCYHAGHYAPHYRVPATCGTVEFLGCEPDNDSWYAVWINDTRQYPNNERYGWYWLFIWE